MCNPMAIGAAIAVVGAGLQYKANKDRQSDMRKLQRRETERQSKLQREAETSLAQNQQSWQRTDLEQKMDMAADERQAQYAKAETNAPRINEALPGQAGSNAVIGDAFARALEGASAEAQQQGALRAQLASFTDAAGQNARENNRRSGDIGMIGSFAQGSANVLPLELQHAATRMRKTAVAGQIMQAVGSAMMGGAGMAGAGAAGAAGTGAMASGGAATGAAAGGGAAAGAAGSFAPGFWSSLFGSAAGAGGGD